MVTNDIVALLQDHAVGRADRTNVRTVFSTRHVGVTLSHERASVPVTSCYPAAKRRRNAVGRKKTQACPGAFDGGVDFGLAMHGQVIEHDHIARPQCGHQHLFDVREEGGVIDRPVKDCRRREAIGSECRYDRVRLPMPARGVIV